MRNQETQKSSFFDAARSRFSGVFLLAVAAFVAWALSIAAECQFGFSSAIVWYLSGEAIRYLAVGVLVGAFELLSFSRARYVVLGIRLFISVIIVIQLFVVVTGKMRQIIATGGWLRISLLLTFLLDLVIAFIVLRSLSRLRLRG